MTTKQQTKQTKTKTQQPTRRTAAPTKETSSRTRTTTTRKSSKNCENAKCGMNNRRQTDVTATQRWLRSSGNRPQTVVITLQRSKEGYIMENAQIYRFVNQHRSVAIPANIRVISEDISKKGVIVK